MSRRKSFRKTAIAALGCGVTLWAGSCGITGLQFRDFLTTSTVRILSDSLYALVETAILENVNQGL